MRWSGGVRGFALGIVSAALTMSAAACLPPSVVPSPSASSRPTSSQSPSASAAILAAAASLGVDPLTTVETTDGVVAAIEDAGIVRLELAEPSGDGWSTRMLASFIEPADRTGTAALDVSCDASFGLSQPNFAYGVVGSDAAAPRASVLVAGLDGQGSTILDRAWVVAFSATEAIRDQRYELQLDRGPQYAVEPIGGGTFRDPQACGTIVDLSQPSATAPPSPPPSGLGRLLLELGATLYGPTDSGRFGTVAIVDPDGRTVFQAAFTEAGVRPVDVPPGDYRIAVTSGLNDCSGSVTVAAGATAPISIEWFAGGCRVDAGSGSPSPGSSMGDATTALDLATRFETARAAGQWVAAWNLLGGSTRTSFGTPEAFEDAEAASNAAGGSSFSIEDPTQDPERIEMTLGASRARIVEDGADMTRGWLMTVSHPQVRGASAASEGLFVAPLIAGGWRVWIVH